MSHSILSSLILMPVIGAVILLFVPKKYTGIIKTSALYISLLVLILSLYWAAFHNLTIYTPEIDNVIEEIHSDIKMLATSEDKQDIRARIFLLVVLVIIVDVLLHY